MTRGRLKARRIGVLMGGTSAEREVSLRSGSAVLETLQAQGYEAVGIDAGRDLAQQLVEQRIEIAFIALHGRHGEDGTVQGLLELLGIPYTDSGVLASALAMDKAATKRLLRQAGIATADFHVYRRGDDVDALVAAQQSYPLVAKPVREGSTIGVTIAHNPQELRAGVLAAAELDREVLVEAFLAGRELTVGVLDGTALPVIQIVPHEGFYDYRNKYTAGRTQYLLPAPLPAALTAELQRAAEQAYRLLGCRGAARVDFIADDDRWICLEVNTIPGMTATSLLPKAAAAAGIPFPELCERLLFDAGLEK